MSKARLPPVLFLASSLEICLKTLVALYMQYNTEETCSAHTKTKPGDNTKYGEYQKIQIIENDLLLKFEWTSTKLNVESAKYRQGAYIKFSVIKK